MSSLSTTFPDGRGKEVDTLGGVLFLVLKRVYSGHGSQKQEVLDAIQKPTMPSSAGDVIQWVQSWRRLLVTLRRLGIALPDLSTLVSVLESLCRRAVEECGPRARAP